MRPSLRLVPVGVLALGGLTGSVSAISVNISAGTLHGGFCDGNSGAAFFKTIPYAEPPIGDGRWAPPQPYRGKYPAEGRDASSPAPSCIQFGKTFAEPEPTSEDCLFLNVWTPAHAIGGSALPVRVWIYGGGNLGGGVSDPLYDGCSVASTNALQVSINYRIGPLGYLALESAGIDGNQGIRDIVRGLEWIQENIAAFGGDPTKVVLSGQSAGAINSFAISTLDVAPRLISAAIFQSGGGSNLAIKRSAQTLGANYATSLNCRVDDAACLRGKSPSELQYAFDHSTLRGNFKTLSAITTDNITSYTFKPNIDGKLFAIQPSQKGVQVPAIFGSVKLEGALFALAQFKSNPASATPQNYSTFLNENFGSLAPLVEQQYPLSAYASLQYPVFTAIAEVIAAYSYKCTAYRGLNNAAARGIPVWTYIFFHESSCAWYPGIKQNQVNVVGPTHTSDIPFTLGQTVNLPAPNGGCNMTDQEQALSAFLVKAWTSLAAHQRPTKRAALWPRYHNAEKSLGVNLVDSAIPGYVNYTACEFWGEINRKQFETVYGPQPAGGNAFSSLIHGMQRIFRGSEL